MTDPETPAATPPHTGALRRAAPALLGYAAVRVLGLVTLAVWSAANGKSAHRLLSQRWDSLWYTRVAELGYGYEVRLPNGDVHANLAFFPLLPWLERLGSAVTPLSYPDAGLLVSAAASIAAAWGIFAVADHVHGHRAGVCAALVWAVLPVGIVQSMAYSESLFTALAAWSLYAVLTGRWLTAGLLAAFAGLTRPVGVAVVAALWVAAITSFVGERAQGGSTPRTDGAQVWRRALAMIIAPLGAAGYVLWVGHRTGKGPLGYLDVQAGWRNGFDGGYAFGRFVAEKLTSFPSALAGVGLIVGVALILWLYVACVRQGQPPALLVHTGIVVALALCASSYFGSKPRLLLPAFPLLFPLAVALARLRTLRSALILGGVAVASAAYGAFWLNGSGPP
ncbi:glycosyltransferase family 39 protein [Streptomyces rhizosphaerihabitans]|uniref:glycosyltransferase family 39 protein n=1 Tax=Streptomyces rhizosphaerihabitans TaxID=1266770 RepID=UPI0021C10C1B|nr:glycosyltransferase family 39 protein [Streptomyces rhizosphaerihabitans]MCT9009863.1 glycosyltransferase family 39 protein [Streptomyces rhizosphaerihabitans]